MAYDAAKAHEYYVNYRKKGLKKGRKKGTGKTTTTKSKTSSLLGVSTSGLNDEGKIQAALTKEKLKKEMNAALSKASTDEERDKIRVEYSRKAQQAMAKLKADSKYAAPKTTKTKSSTQSFKGSAKVSAKGSSGSGSTKTKASSGSSGSSKAAKATTSTTGSKTKAVPKAAINSLKNNLTVLQKLTMTASPEQKKLLKSVMQQVLNSLVKMKGLSADEKKKFSKYITA